MPSTNDSATRPAPRRMPVWLGLCLFLAIAGFLLWEEHRAHLLGALPYVFLLLCPVIHLFMHRGHGAHAGRSGGVNPRHSHEDHQREA